jgi:hypothetical protein
MEKAEEEKEEILCLYSTANSRNISGRVFILCT